MITSTEQMGDELTVAKWFSNIWVAVKTIAKGMGITIRYAIKVKEVSIEYPEEREIIPTNSRSRLFNDVKNCISCYQCANICPVNCIYITATRRDKEAPKIQTDDGTAIRLDLQQYVIDTALCCYCGLCTTVCPTKCLTHTTEYEYSAYTVSDMKYDYRDPEVMAYKQP